MAAALTAGITGDARVLAWVAACAIERGWRWRDRRRRFASYLFLIFLFYVYGNTAIGAYEGRAARLAPHVGDTLVVRGVVESFPAVRFGKQNFLLSARVDGEPTVLRARSAGFTIDYGDSLLVRGVLKNVAARSDTVGSRYLMSIGAAGDLSAHSARELGGRGGNGVVRRIFWPLHDRIRQGLARGFGAASGLPLALLLGERGSLDPNVREAFNRLGISHLLALSGFHLGLVAAAVLGVQRLLRCPSAGVLLVVLAGYVGTVGSIVSLTRSFVMIALMVAARVARRPMNPLGALAGAYVLILLGEPCVIYALSFQLSFVATFAVLLCVARLPSPRGSLANRVLGAVAASLAVSCAAQLFVAPLILAVFGRISAAAPIATLVCVPGVALLLLVAALGAVLSLAHAGAGLWACGVLDPLCRLFSDGVVALAAAGPAAMELPSPNAGAWYGGLICAWYARDRWWMRVLGIALMLLSFTKAVDGALGFMDF